MAAFNRKGVPLEPSLNIVSLFSTIMWRREGGNVSCWWRDILSTCYAGAEDGWFNKGTRRVIGEGRGILFWNDFVLYNLSLQQSSTIYVQSSTSIMEETAFVTRV